MGLGRTTRALLLGSAGLTLIVLGQRAALAQTAPETTPAGAKEPAQNTSAAGKSTRLDKITVVSRTGESAMETMASASHVDQEDIERRMASTPTDVFFGMPGVTGQADGRRVDSSINIRGLQDFGRVAVIVDGARQDFQRSDHGTQSTFWIDPDLIQSVDVIRGPVANTYGSGAIGGVVFFDTKDAGDFLKPDETWAVSETGRYETNGRGWSTSTTGAYRFSDSADILGNIVYRDYGDYKSGDGDRQVGTGYDVLGGMLKGTFRPTDYSELKLGWIGASDGWNEISGGVPVYDLGLKQNTFTARYNITDPDRTWLDLHINTSYNKARLDQTALVDVPGRFDPTTGDPVVLPAGSKSIFDIGTLSFDIWNTSRFQTGGVAHELTYGGDWVSDDVDTSGVAGGSSFYTPSGRRTVWGGYIQDKASWEWLEVVAGLRYDSYNLKGGGIDHSGGRLSPRITVGVSPFDGPRLDGLQFYGTYAEGYRSPSLSETLISGLHPAGITFPFLPNPGLTPETGKTWEFGVNYKTDSIFQSGDALRLKAAYFHNDIDDYIGIVDDIPAGTGACPAVPPGVPIFDPANGMFAGYYYPYCAQYQNFANARIQGVELESVYDANWGFAGLSASFINGHTVSYSGERGDLTTIPAAQVTGQLGFKFLEDKLIVGGEVQYNRKPKGNPIADDYTLVNAFASYHVNDNFKFDFRVDNIFDVNYANALNIGTSSTVPAVYEPGVTFKLAATMRWGG
jgi:hemoglobin/transferrin/lactoferrin receptor protein